MRTVLSLGTALSARKTQPPPGNFWVIRFTRLWMTRLISASSATDRLRSGRTSSCQANTALSCTAMRRAPSSVRSAYLLGK